MKVTVKNRLLCDALRAAGLAVNPKTPIPLLTNVLLKVTPEGLKIDGYDTLLGGASVVREVSDAMPGATAVDYFKLTNLVQRIGDDDSVTLSQDKDHLTIRSAGCEYGLLTMSPAEWPDVPKPTAAVAPVRVPAQALAAAIKATQHAVSDNAHRPQLSGLLLDFTGETLAVVGCDGVRIARYTIPLSAPVQAILLPPRAISPLNKLAMRGSSEVSIGVSGSSLFFWTDTDGYGAAMSGSEPIPHAKLVKRGHDVVEVRTTLLRDALMRVQTVSREVTLLFDRDVLTITGADALVGKGEETVELEHGFGGKLIVHAYAAQLLDATGPIEGELTTIAVSNTLEPIYLSGSDVTYEAIVMPLNPNR